MNLYAPSSFLTLCNLQQSADLVDTLLGKIITILIDLVKLSALKYLERLKDMF